MREMDSLGLKLCSYQAKLFEGSIEGTKSSSAIFIRRFMNSDLAKRMDSLAFAFDSLDAADALAEIDAQYGTSTYGSIKFSLEEMHWIGYIYRYWAYTSDIPSRQLYKKIKPQKLRLLFFPYHSLDPAQAIERIAEDIGTQGENTDDISKGVLVLRKIRQKTVSGDGST